MAALSSLPVVFGPCFLSEEDVPGSSLNGRKPLQLKNNELRFWLKCRGDSCKGLSTKALLVKRVEEYISCGLEGYICDPDQNKIYTRRKINRLQPSNSSSLVTDCSLNENDVSVSKKVVFPTTGWNLSLEKSPLFTRTEVDRHIAKSGKNVAQAVNHSVPTGMTRATSYLKDEYLHNIETNSDQRYFFFKAKCFHSFKVNEQPHELKLALCIVSGDVEYAYCGPTCAAGKSGFCNHMLALMLKVCKYSLYGCSDVKTLRNEDDERPTPICTSTLQQWNKPRDEGVHALPVMEVTASKTRSDSKKQSQGITSQLYEARKNDSNFSDHLDTFLDSLKKIDPKLGLVQVGSNPVPNVETQYGMCPRGSYGSYQLGYTESNFKVWVSGIDTVQRRDIDTTANFPVYPPFPLSDFNESFDLPIPTNLNNIELTKLNSLKVDHKETETIEEHTRKQSDSQMWRDERKFRITASDFHRVKIRKRNNEKLAQDLISPKLFTSESTRHGLKYESVALREYSSYMSKTGRPVKVLKSGFCISEKLFVLGCTPDARIVDPTCREEFGLAEVKCPHSKFSVSPLEACSDPNFCLDNDNGILKLKKNHGYYDQVQGQMGVTGASWCDFIVYTRKGLAIHRILFDAQHWNELRSNLCQFYFKYFLTVAAKS